MWPIGCGPRSCRGTNARVLDRLADFQMHQMSLAGGAVLEKGCVYLVPLQESLRLPEDAVGGCQCEIFNRAA